MKIAFVVGFFEPVKAELDRTYPGATSDNRIIWIAEERNAAVAFKGRFYDVAKTASGILVCLASSGSRQGTAVPVRGIVTKAAMDTVQLQEFGNVYDPVPLVAAINAFGLDHGRTFIEPHRIRLKVTHGKILCVCPAGRTSIRTALSRAGFSEQAINECFEEDVRATSRNSNLMQELESRANTYSCLLYAWEGLRTSTSEVKRAYKFGFLEARSAAQVVEMFKNWIMEGD